MLDRLLCALSGADALIRASRSSDRQAFATLFGHWSISFLHLPPGLEAGLDPNVSQEELLAQIKGVVRDLSGRDQFVPFYSVREGRKCMPLFTQQVFVQKFVQVYVRKVNRIMPFQVLTLEGRMLVPSFRDAGVVLNAGSKFEYELSADDVAFLAKLCASQQPPSPVGT